MSDAMTSGEIEDVLSSIRRLVSDDLRPAPRTGKAALVTDDHDKLILTPALRVLPGGIGIAPDAVAGPAAMDSADEDHRIATGAGAENDPRPVVEDDPSPRDDVLLLVVQVTSRPEAAAAAAPGEATPQDVAPGAETDPWEQDAADPDARDEGPDLAGASEPRAQTTTAVAPDPAGPESPVPGSAIPEPVRAETVISAIGAAMRTTSAPWEPETGDASPVTRLSWIDVADDPSDNVPPRFVHRAEAQIDDGQSMEPSPLVGITEDVLDEALLRDIVRAVLREELQGHLGERITRNIRKLVRAEINRSLTLRDYE
ncbi:MAG: hypothetical protein ACK4L4_04830 [Gemmobacter sp.]